VATDLANSKLPLDGATRSEKALAATSDSAPVINGNKSTVVNKSPGTLPPRAVDGYRRKVLTRRRHQDGQLIKLKHGWAARHYENGEGERRRVQKFLGTFEELPTRRSAQNRMQSKLTVVNTCFTVNPRTTTTFRVFAYQWIEDCEQRKQKPIKPSVSHNWRRILANHLFPLIGEVPLSDVGNRTMRSVVERLAKKKLSPKTIQNITLVVKLVKSSPVDDDGNELYPTKWNSRFIDAPSVDPTKQRKPSFTSAEVETIVKAATGRVQMAAILFAATGLRAGELLALEIRHFDGTSITVSQALWHAKMGTPKTENAFRTVDLHPDVAALLKTFVGDRKTGFIFQTRSGKPLNQVNLLRRELHPLLETLGISMRGFHAFRRFRNTFLRQSHCPDGVLKFWMGHADGNMSDRYDRSREDVQYRKDVAKSMGVGFELPKTLNPKYIKRGKTSLSGAIGRCEQMVEQVVSG
jgi:integrase